MPTFDVLRFAALCVMLAAAETLHGIARTVWLVPRVGKATALKWSVVTGSLLAFGLCWVFVPAIGAEGWRAHLGRAAGAGHQVCPAHRGTDRRAGCRALDIARAR